MKVSVPEIGIMGTDEEARDRGRRSTIMNAINNELPLALPVTWIERQIGRTLNNKEREKAKLAWMLEEDRLVARISQRPDHAALRSAWVEIEKARAALQQQRDDIAKERTEIEAAWAELETAEAPPASSSTMALLERSEEFIGQASVVPLKIRLKPALAEKATRIAKERCKSMNRFCAAAIAGLVRDVEAVDEGGTERQTLYLGPMNRQRQSG